jgi:hypothetical protein
MKAAFVIPTASNGISFPETGIGMSHNLTTTATIVANIDPQVDVIFQMQKGFKHFIDSGQGWALLIGFFIGYLFRSLTAY